MFQELLFIGSQHWKRIETVSRLTCYSSLEKYPRILMKTEMNYARIGVTSDSPCNECIFNVILYALSSIVTTRSLYNMQHCLDLLATYVSFRQYPRVTLSQLFFQFIQLSDKHFASNACNKNTTLFIIANALARVLYQWNVFELIMNLFKISRIRGRSRIERAQTFQGDAGRIFER